MWWCDVILWFACNSPDKCLGPTAENSDADYPDLATCAGDRGRSDWHRLAVLPHHHRPSRLHARDDAVPAVHGELRVSSIQRQDSLTEIPWWWWWRRRQAATTTTTKGSDDYFDWAVIFTLQVNLLTGLPFLSIIPAIYAAGTLADFLRRRRIMSTTAVRKVADFVCKCPLYRLSHSGSTTRSV